MSRRKRGLSPMEQDYPTVCEWVRHGCVRVDDLRAELERALAWIRDTDPKGWRDKPDDELTSEDIAAMVAEGQPVEVRGPRYHRPPTECFRVTWGSEPPDRTPGEHDWQPFGTSNGGPVPFTCTRCGFLLQPIITGRTS